MTRENLIARDGGVCVWCGREPWPADLTAEHLLPRSRRGRTLPENLAPACRSCNKRRRTKPVVAYVRAQRQDGRAPRIDLLAAALGRLSRSESPVHAEYAARQLALLERLQGTNSPTHPDRREPEDADRHRRCTREDRHAPGCPAGGAG